ncbi:MAG: hypothetical protein RL557_879 [archaeon]|jgi:hypothetical protein
MINCIHNFRNWNRLSQVTIFIILALVVVGGIALFFLVREGIVFGGVPKQFEPVYAYYVSCIEDEVHLASSLLGSQGGYIDVPAFSGGSSYMPFSSQLDFLGNPVPYWYYISGNNLVKEQVPTREQMEQQLNQFVEERIVNCDFSAFAEQGYSISLENDAAIESSIETNSIEISVGQELSISFGNDSYTADEHRVSVLSNLGRFYETAKKIYDDFKETMFLEEYGVDILRLYAPVDGTEFTCSPLVWSMGAVRENLTRALEANVGFIKVKGNYYDISGEDNQYFVHDIGDSVDMNVNFLYLREWPMKVEAWPSDGSSLRASPIGLEEGYGMLGFCYVPYHFVYDFGYPVLIQLYEGDELFQFPVVVFINKNKPREALSAQGAAGAVSELCLHKNILMKVHTSDFDGNPIGAAISFKCFDSECSIGDSELASGDALLESPFPQCYNGFIVARADGYETAEVLTSTIDEQEISIALKKMHTKTIRVEKNGAPLSGTEYALIVFKKENGETIVNYPEQKEIALSEGQYQIKTYVYSPLSITVKGSVTHTCTTVPVSGISSVFGQTEENCFDYQSPDQEITTGISGGGNQPYYFSESELETSNTIRLDVGNFGVPTRVEDIQLYHTFVENSSIDVFME